MSLATPVAQTRLAGEELIDAMLSASRVLVTVAARSLGGHVEDVTLPQYRVLVELADRGPQRVADLAALLVVDRSTATRMCDRLVRKHLVTRRRISSDRRGVRIALASSGRELIAEVAERRRAEIRKLLRGITVSERAIVLGALRSFAARAGEVPETDFSVGWHPPIQPERGGGAVDGQC